LAFLTCNLQPVTCILLGAAGIRCVWFESEGTDHEWLTWRRCLRDFVPRLFKTA